MELFFDLIFVAAVAQVGTPLGRDYTLTGLLRYSFLFVLIWWAWSGHTLYSTRFHVDDLLQRIFVLLQSFIAAVMAANAKQALDSRDAGGFAAAYAGMRVILVLQYLRARRIPETRQITNRFAAGFGAAAIAWIASAVAPPPTRYFLWAAALIIDSVTPWWASRSEMKIPPDADHFPERFGLFTIILLGEFVASVMRGIESQETWSVPAATTAIASMAVGFTLAWWYFDGVQGAAPRHVHTPGEARWFEIWNYSHLPLSLGIGVAGVGLERAIAPHDPGMDMSHDSAILCCAIGVIMLALTMIGAASAARPQHYFIPRYVIALAVTLAAPFAPALPGVVVVLALLAACILQGVLARS